MQTDNLLIRILHWARSHKVLTFVILFMVFLFVVISQFGFVQVDIKQSGDNSESKVQLLNQKTLKSSVSSSKESSFKKLVRRGSYEVSVFSDSGTSFLIKDVGGFLKTSKVSANLKSENYSEFVGYTPKSCVNYNKVVAVSWGCMGDVGMFTIHRPAIGLQPTYNESGPKVLTGKQAQSQPASSGEEYEESADELNGTIESIFESNGSNYMLVREVGYGESDSQHVIYSLDNDYQIGKRTTVKGLDSKKTYSVEGMGNGFLIYDTSMSNFYTYDTADSKPKRLTFDSPANQQIKPSLVKTSGSKIYILYSNYIKDGESDQKPKSLINSVITVDGDSSYSQSFDGMYIDQFSTCGNGFCILSNGTLNIYGLVKNKPKYLYEVKQVDTVINVGKVLLVSKPEGTVSLSVDNKSGYFGHTNNGLESCGIVYVHKDYYVDCVVDKYKRRSLLSVDTTKNSQTKISKVVNDISNIKNVTGMSVYKNNIIINPDAGEFTRDPKTGSFGYDPVVQKSSIKSLKSSISKLGFDLSDYDVHIVGDN